MKTPKQLLKEEYLLIENDKTCECHTHLVVGVMEKYANMKVRERNEKALRYLDVITNNGTIAMTNGTRKCYEGLIKLLKK